MAEGREGLATMSLELDPGRRAGVFLQPRVEHQPQVRERQRPRVADSKDGRRKGRRRGQRGGRQDFTACTCRRGERGERWWVLVLAALVNVLGHAWSWEGHCRGLWEGAYV